MSALLALTSMLGVMPEQGETYRNVLLVPCNVGISLLQQDMPEAPHDSHQHIYLVSKHKRVCRMC